MLLVLAGCATQQERAEQRARVRQVVTEAVSSRQLHIDIKSMNTMRYGMRMVTTDFFLELKDDTLVSYLPYLGQVHQAPMTSPSIGLNFEMPVLRYAVSRPKTNYSRLEMNVRTQEDVYQYVVDVYDTGEAHISVLPQNRDAVSFDGYVKTY